MHKSTAKFVHWLKASRYTIGLKGIFYLFRESSAVGEGHQSAPFTILRCGLMVAVPLGSSFDFLACSNAQLG